MKKNNKKADMPVKTITRILIWLVIVLIIAGSLFYLLKKLGYI